MCSSKQGYLQTLGTISRPNMKKRMFDLWQETVFIFWDQTMRAFLGGLEIALLLPEDNKARDSDTSHFKISSQAVA